MGLLWVGEAGARTCPDPVLNAPKGNVVYLYYPAATDTQFPSFTGNSGVDASPLQAFNMGQLPSAIGTQSDLMTRVGQLVATSFCEFDVGVRSTIAPPAPAEPRWQIVGIGTDSAVPAPGGVPIGLAQHVDFNDLFVQEHVRIWLGDLASWAGAELSAIPTLERWATTLANLILHETGHNYGSDHPDAVPRIGEDASVNHFMAPGCTPSVLTTCSGAKTAQIMTGSLEHHSDRSYEILGHSAGLAAQTVSNWDFVNPNAGTADRLEIELLVAEPDPNPRTVGWWYSGSQNPWQEPALAVGFNGPVIRGVSYRIDRLIFSLPKSTWANGPGGQVPGGATFHVGTTILGGPYSVRSATLFSGGLPMELHPRMIDYQGTAGFLMAAPRRPSFDLSLTNPEPERGPLLLSDVDVQLSPRMIDIETMVAGAIPRDMDGRPVALYSRRVTKDRPDILGRAALRGKTFKIGREPVEIPIAAFTDPRHVMIDHLGCQGRPPARARRIENPSRVWFDQQGECAVGTSLSLFPATYVYVSATLTDPAARHWDRRLRRMVEGPVSTRIFFQIAGTVPDANRNGVDDLLDIRSGKSVDRNRDGVPDEALRRGPSGSSGDAPPSRARSHAR